MLPERRPGLRPIKAQDATKIRLETVVGGLAAPLTRVPAAEPASHACDARDPPALALLAPDDGTLAGALMAADRLVVATGLLVLLGGAGFLAVARLPRPAWRLTRRLERRAWWLLRVAWWATLVGTLVGLLLYGPFTAGLPLSRMLDAMLVDQTLRTRFGATWAVRVLLLLLLALLRVWSERQAAGMRTSAWVAVGGLAAALVVTPALSGHAAAGPDAAVGAVIGVVHFWAAAVWFGGLVLLGTCLLADADAGLLQAVPRFSAVAFTAMVVIVVTGILQGWRQVGSCRHWGRSPMAACWWPRWRCSCFSSWSPAAAGCWSGAS